MHGLDNVNPTKGQRSSVSPLPQSTKNICTEKKMIFEMIEPRNKIESLLSEEQCKKLGTTHDWGMGHGMGFGMMP